MRGVPHFQIVEPMTLIDAGVMECGMYYRIKNVTDRKPDHQSAATKADHGPEQRIQRQRQEGMNGDIIFLLCMMQVVHIAKNPHLMQQPAMQCVLIECPANEPHYQFSKPLR